MSRTKRFLSFAITIALAIVVATPLLSQEVEQVVEDAERLLIPILTPPVRGAFGSEFHTELRIANTGQDFVAIDGLTAICPTCLAPNPSPLLLPPGAEAGPGQITLNGTPGRFVYAYASSLDTVPMNLRVYDATRAGQNFGTEIPIVRARDFSINALSLVGVPTDPRFRNTLRIYSDFPGDVLVTVGNLPPVRVRLTNDDGSALPGQPSNPFTIYTPAYGVFTNFPSSGGAPVRVTITGDPDIVTLLPIETRLWAFITVTNNDTQAIATITPQP